MSQENVEVVRPVYEAWERGNLLGDRTGPNQP
jgi:hypothetical protein